eukprot:8695-Heterococcus_DN1.PRE.3
MLLLTCFLFIGGVLNAAFAQTTNELRSKAESLLSEGDVAQALDLFDAVVLLEPKNERNYYKRFRAHLKNASYKEAISDLSAALALKPKYKQALAQRAKLYRLLGQCQQSSADYQALQVLDAAHAEVAAGMGPAAQCAAQLHEAQTNFQANNFHRAREAFSSVLDTMSE